MEMRRSERQVTDLETIYDMLGRCDTMVLAMNDEKVPYVIPMTFACAMEDGKIVVYFHSAQGGKKWELLNKDPYVCIESHIYYSVVAGNGAPTAKYESVIGNGKVEKIEGHDAKVAAFKLILDHYAQSGFPAQSCKGLSRCDMFKVALSEVTGKRNL